MSTRRLSNLLVPLSGPAIWAAHFFAVYAAEGVLCSQAKWAVPPVWLGLTTVALTVLLAVVLRAPQFRLSDETGAVTVLTGPLAVLSAIAVCWSAVPLFLLPACTPAHT
jgi:hypothetical protein